MEYTKLKKYLEQYSPLPATDVGLWSIGYDHLQEMYARTSVGDRHTFVI